MTIIREETVHTGKPEIPRTHGGVRKADAALKETAQ